MKKNAFVHVVARVKKTVPPHLKIVIRQKGIVADVRQSAIWLNLIFAEYIIFSLYLIYIKKVYMCEHSDRFSTLKFNIFETDFL